METIINIFRYALDDRELSPSEFLELGLETIAFCRNVGLLGDTTVQRTEDLLAGLIVHWGMDPQQLLQVGPIKDLSPLKD